jgi:hypothetical protein
MRQSVFGLAAAILLVGAAPAGEFELKLSGDSGTSFVLVEVDLAGGQAIVSEGEILTPPRGPL